MALYQGMKRLHVPGRLSSGIDGAKPLCLLSESSSPIGVLLTNLLINSLC